MNGLELESTRFYLLNQAIFSLIPTLKLLRLQKEKIDFLLALCESLCNEKDNIDLSILDKTVVSILDLNNLAEIELLSGINSFTILESCGSQEPFNRTNSPSPFPQLYLYVQVSPFIVHFFFSPSNRRSIAMSG